MYEEEMTTFFFFIVIILIAGIILTWKIDNDLDSKLEKECRSCDSKAIYCIDYWKEKGRCGR